MAHKVGPYVLGKTLGVGSTGRVKLGTHVETNQTVAVKIISKEWLASKASLSKKIEREITLMKLIRHPNVMMLYDVYESDMELYLVLEFVEGGELFEYLVKRGRLPEKEALIFFQQIINGLDYCHKHMICHRDLKPENLLLDANFNVKIADFGMATIQQEGKRLETSCGSPHYASPEIIKGVKYDGGAADIWSCGVILYALLTGNLPFDDENIRKLLQKVKSGLYFMPSSLSEDSQDLIRRMLVVDPEKRITMEEIKNHKWFKSNSNVLPEPFPVQIAHLSDVDDIDPEIISNLMTLGWDTEQELISAILSPEDNVEKVFYQFLYERKCEFLENGGEDQYEDPSGAGPRRRADSFSAEFTQRRSSGGSIKLRPSSIHSTTSANGSNGDINALQKKQKPLSVDIPSKAVSQLSINSPVSNSPKRSWFANLFNFKGTVLLMKTTSAPEASLEEIKRVLGVHNIKFQPGSKETALKCKHEGQGEKASLKGCKFRIEVSPQEGETDVIFMHQQGSGSSYRAIFELIKNDLNLKDKRVVAPPAPLEK